MIDAIRTNIGDIIAQEIKCRCAHDFEDAAGQIIRYADIANSIIGNRYAYSRSVLAENNVAF